MTKIAEEKLSIEQAFALALQLHQTGDLEKAETIYKKILQVNPNHYQSLGNLAAIVGKSKNMKFQKNY